MNISLSIAGIYIFILLGFLAKKIAKDKIDSKTLVFISLYLLQPFLTFWGIAIRDVNFLAFRASLHFFTISMFFLIITIIVGIVLFKDKKDRSILSVGVIVGNTGNLGIPLAIALFGESSILYTSIINLTNVFIVFTIGVYLYSRGTFSIKESIFNIFKLPAIWVGIFSIYFSLKKFYFPQELLLPLTMGAYGAIVLQLIIFGAYLAQVSIKEIDLKLLGVLSFLKFVVIPVGVVIYLSFFKLPPLLHDVILLETIVPMAVMNVNLSALYNCYPQKVAFLTFATSIIFLIYLGLLAKYLFILV